MAQTKITTRSLGLQEVKTNNLEDLSVTSSKIANSSITQEKLNVENLDSLPVGTVIYYPNVAPPPGYLVADGSILSRTVYAALFSVIGTTFNIGGELSTDFRLPDLRGEFIRGLDNGRNINIGRSLGSFEDWSTGRPKRTDNPHRLLNSASGGQNLGNASPPNLLGFARVTNVGETATCNGVDVAGSGWEVDQLNVVDGDPETRPRNIALQPCIKWTQLSNISNVAVNVNALAATKFNTTGGTFTGTIQSQNPKFHAHDGPNQIVTPNATTAGVGALVITFLSTTVNIGNGMNPTTGRFTAPVAGTYYFSFGGMAGGNNYVRWRFIRGNGATVIGSIGDERFCTAQQYENFVGDCMVQLNANDWVEIRMGWANGELNNLHGGYRHFTGYLMA